LAQTSDKWATLTRHPFLADIAKQFTSFLNDQDLDKFEAGVRASLPHTRRGSVDEFMLCMEVWLKGNTQELPLTDAWNFFDRELAELAAQAREAAVEAQGQLL
jgi:hypothetical protein